MQSYETALAFHQIKEQLAAHAVTQNARERADTLQPCMEETRCRRQMEDTTKARILLEQSGTPPLADTAPIRALMSLAASGAMLLPEQLELLASFAGTTARLKAYLNQAQSGGSPLAGYGGALADFSELRAEIERCIRHGQVDTAASPGLRGIRRSIENARAQIQTKLNSILQSRKDCFTERTIVRRGGRFVLPVKQSYKNRFPGSVLDISASGGTYFMEPAAVGRLQEQIGTLEAEEEQEIRKVLYQLTVFAEEQAADFKTSMELMETLDFLFAKAKLSRAMDAAAPELTMERRLDLRQARHPLLRPEKCVALDIRFAPGVQGIVITGPNTGGKTVALKTLGLLSLMAQSGLHIPAEAGSTCCMFSRILCDIGDGQSITESLSTFSAHITQVIAILDQADRDSLVLLDELGSGTDPQEGMGIAAAVLEALCQTGCLLAVTTHYPEMKRYAAERAGLVNARMAFDRDTMRPTYRLEIGQAGESCALDIAKRLGLPKPLLGYARRIAYGSPQREAAQTAFAQPPDLASPRSSGLLKASAVPKEAYQAHFAVGDSVWLLPHNELGIVYRPDGDDGLVTVQVKGEKRQISHKRLKLHVGAQELYPEDYDFSILFDSVETRKARHQMGKRHRPDLEIRLEGESDKQDR
ncbi:MAG: DNA mismatch repair protein MutS [Clostridiales bacterium]|nr:DNA mismatch repair protein MutS [Clostridiales bacterium]